MKRKKITLHDSRIGTVIGFENGNFPSYVVVVDNEIKSVWVGLVKEDQIK